MQHSESSRKRSIEERLWDLHGKVNSYYRKQLKHLKTSRGQKRIVEQRKVGRRFLEFIKSSQRFYRNFVQGLHSFLGGVKELDAIADRLTLSTQPSDGNVATSRDSQWLILNRCHQALIHLGDLSRWREALHKTEKCDWGPAKCYYDLARRIYPASGTSHHQLAVIALQDANHLEAVYHLLFALAVEEPHPSAKDNLDIEIKKIEDSWNERDQFDVQATTIGQISGNDTESLFARLHVYHHKGQKCSEQEELEYKALEKLVADLKTRSGDATLRRVVLVNIAAEYLAGQRLRSEF